MKHKNIFKKDIRLHFNCGINVCMYSCLLHKGSSDLENIVDNLNNNNLQCKEPYSIIFARIKTLCLLVSSADNLCKQFGSNLSGLIWIQTVKQSAYEKEHAKLPKVIFHYHKDLECN